MTIDDFEIAKAVLGMGGVVMIVPCDFCDENPCQCYCPLCHTTTCTDCCVVCESTEGCKCTT